MAFCGKFPVRGCGRKQATHALAQGVICAAARDPQMQARATRAQLLLRGQLARTRTPACVRACVRARLRSWEDLVDVADRDVARVGAVRVSAAAEVDSELERGHHGFARLGFCEVASFRARMDNLARSSDHCGGAVAALARSPSFAGSHPLAGSSGRP